MQTDSGGHKGTASNFNHSVGFSSFITPTSSRNLISRLKLIKVQCMYLSTTTLFDGRGIASIYYIRYNYMFRRLTMAIFRLYMKY